jgi:parvulin-like peptidyl-prolyl isomerase
MRRRIHVLLFLTVLLGVLAGCSETSPIMARVGNTNISEAQFTQYMERNKPAFDPANSEGRSPEQIRFELFQNLIVEEVALEEARRNGYGLDSVSEQAISGIIRQETAQPGKEPTFADFNNLATSNNFASYADVRLFLARRFTLDALATNIEIAGIPRQTFVREVVVPVAAPADEEKARLEAAGYAEQLRNGAALEGIVAKYQSDPQIGQLQGDLGWVNPEGGGPDFAAAANSIPLNQWSDPVRSEFGWHVFQVTGRRTAASWQEFMQNPQTQQFMLAKIQEYKDTGAYEVYIDPASIPTPGNVTQQK